MDINFTNLIPGYVSRVSRCRTVGQIQAIRKAKMAFGVETWAAFTRINFSPCQPIQWRMCRLTHVSLLAKY
eukprot:scaffold33348_cov55-Prasinocladus_malaysianus.AAC.1